MFFQVRDRSKEGDRAIRKDAPYHFFPPTAGFLGDINRLFHSFMYCFSVFYVVFAKFIDLLLCLFYWKSHKYKMCLNLLLRVLA